MPKSQKALLDLMKVPRSQRNDLSTNTLYSADEQLIMGGSITR